MKFLFALLIFASHLSAEPLRVRTSSEVSTLDWNKATDSSSLFVIFQLMRGLVRIDEHHQIKPDLASSWSISKDRKTLTFQIRKNIFWSDEVLLKAQDFADSLKRIQDPKTASPSTHYFSDIESAEAPSRSVLKIHLKRPVSYVLALLSHPCAFPIRKDLIEKYETHWTEADKLVVLGPYRIASSIHDQKISLVVNKNSYYRASLPVDLLVIIEDRTASDLFDDRKLDIVIGVASAEVAKRKSQIQIHSLDRVTGILFNKNISPFIDNRVREAFSIAISRQRVVRLFNIDQKPNDWWLPIGMSDHVVSDHLNIEKARELLAQAGYPEGKGLPAITFSIPARAEVKIFAEQIQSQLKETLGAKIEIQSADFKTYLANLSSVPAALNYFSWGTAYPDPSNFLETFVNGGLTEKAWTNLKYDQLVEKYKTDPTRQTLSDAEEILTSKDIAVLPILNDVQVALIAGDVTGYNVISGRIYFEKLGRK